MSDTPYTYQAWPSWRYGPNGEAEIFQCEEQVPAGWVDDPNKIGEKVEVAPEADKPRRGRPPKAPAEESQF